MLGSVEADRRQEKVRRPWAYCRSCRRRRDAVAGSFDHLPVSRDSGVAVRFDFVIAHVRLLDFCSRLRRSYGLVGALAHQGMVAPLFGGQR